MKDFDTTEWKCIGGSVFAGVLWLASGEPILALLGSYAVDLFAAFPTMRQAFYKPLEEPVSAWVLTVLGNAFNMLAVPSWSLATIDSVSIWSYPVYMLTVNGVILLLLLRSSSLSRA